VSYRDSKEACLAKVNDEREDEKEFQQNKERYSSPSFSQNGYKKVIFHLGFIMPGLTKSELNDLLDKPLIAKFSTVTPDGWPYTNPVWFAHEDGKILIIPRKHSRFVEHIKKNPKVCVLVDETTAPYAKVQILGTAKILEGPITGGRWVEIARRMAARYFGPSIGPKYIEGTLDQPRYLVEVTPVKIATWRGTGKGDRTEWHPRYYDEGTKWYKEYHAERQPRTKDAIKVDATA
jgi:nitroimidazol reductase NimA-like FMN-containing flavoprotein (pyridoxamine 5'-phosphate oxidase superfamily)